MQIERVAVIGAGTMGHGIGKAIAYAWLPIEHATLGTRVEVAYFDSVYGGTVSDDPQFDPTMSRIKS